MINLSKRITTLEVQRTKLGSEVVVAGFVEQTKLLGKMAFLKLRDREGYVQIVATSNYPKMKDLNTISRESVISIRGRVKKSRARSGGKELELIELNLLSRAATPLPIEFLGKNIETDLSKRLDWRFLDMRNKKIQAIFEIKDEIARAFREFFRNEGFTEIWTPSIISSSSEGGTELFEAKYFNKKVFLAQSPQLYKQMAVMSNLEKVFMISPVWRAEPHDTHKHLNEVRQMDIEVAFAGQKEVINYLDRCVKYIVRSVLKNCKSQVALVNPGLKVPASKYISYDEAIATLQKQKFKIKWGSDISSEAEQKLGDIFGRDNLLHIHNWPSAEKPFYIMPQGEDPSAKYSEGFDTEYGGIELSSGGQRVHIPVILEKQLKERGLKPKDFKRYIDSFRYGAPPHAGWSIGLERLTMIITGRANIRESVLFPRTRDRLTP